MNLKVTLRDLIESAGLTQREAAAALGVAYRTLQYWLAEESPHLPPQMALDALRWQAYRDCRQSECSRRDGCACRKL